MTHNPEYRRLINSGRWRRLRHAVLERDPFCADCALAGVTRSATEVHHVVPVETVRGRGAMERLCFDTGNLVGLCHDCHRRRHQELGKNGAEEKRRREDRQREAFRKKYFGEDPGGGFQNGEGAL